MPRSGPRRPYVGVRLDPEQLDWIDAVVDQSDETLSRSEVIRRLVAYGIEHSGLDLG